MGTHCGPGPAATQRRRSTKCTTKLSFSRHLNLVSRSPRSDSIGLGPGPPRRLALRSSRDSLAGRAPGSKSEGPRFDAVLSRGFKGLLREVTPGHLARAARITPLDQAASRGSSWATSGPPITPTFKLLGRAHCRGAAPGIELGTSRALSENHATEPSNRLPSRR